MRKNWDIEADALFEQGSFGACVERLVDRRRRDLDLELDLSLQLAYYLYALREYGRAADELAGLLPRFFENFDLRLNLGSCLIRAGRLSEALEHFEFCESRGRQDAVVYDGLCTCFASLQRPDEARAAGTRALSIKHEQAISLVQAQKSLATVTEPRAGRRDVIAFSLFGDGLRYLRGAVDNVIACGQVYPNWAVRIYHDDTVPLELLEFLSTHGADLRREDKGQSLRNKLGWRFKVASDPEVDWFMVRDIDAVVSTREALAVHEWQRSGKTFHVMRDWWTHTDLILAGMWGGKSGLFDSIYQELLDYRPPHLETANIDQWFLRDRVWPAIQGDVIVHDRYFDSPGAIRWPSAHVRGNAHVGQDVYTAAREQQRSRIERVLSEQPELHWLCAEGD